MFILESALITDSGTITIYNNGNNKYVLKDQLHKIHKTECKPDRTAILHFRLFVVTDFPGVPASFNMLD